jgi:hypothetical protein
MISSNHSIYFYLHCKRIYIHYLLLLLHAGEIYVIDYGKPPEFSSVMDDCHNCAAPSRLPEGEYLKEESTQPICSSTCPWEEYGFTYKGSFYPFYMFNFL